jgi:probable H4MPT-linked C1 transfer pathway protein
MNSAPAAVTGWDVGGVNTKVARVEAGLLRALRSIPFEIQRAPDDLAPLIARLAGELGSEVTDHHAVTMTAELSQHFLTKREGVAFVLDAFERALPGRAIHVLGTDGVFRSTNEARLEYLLSSASNWAATAALVARKWPHAVLVDVGTTTTDVIPVRAGMVVARGRTDPGRLRSGELLYLGAIRTPVEAIVQEVPLGDSMAGVSAESFALTGDVYLWLGEIAEGEYTAPTPDGRAANRTGARDRLARVVCADSEMLDDAAIDAIARHVARVQAERVARSLERVIAHHPSTSLVVTAGLGSFIARRATSLVRPAPLAVAELGADFTPAAAAALLLAEGHHQLIVSAQAGTVVPAQAGIHVTQPNMDPRLRGDDYRVHPRLRGDGAPVRRDGDVRVRGDEGAASRGGEYLERGAALESTTSDVASGPVSPRAHPIPAPITTVVKVGGALLGRQGALDIVVPVLSRVAERGDPVLVVPGGGPFADAVRRIDTELRLSDDAAHWMAILALDQYAELLASRISLSRVVRDPAEASAALAAGMLPILAPSTWLRRSDPLPHSWDVTSDSIAAWVAGEVGAERLVLAKAAKADLSALVDPHFARALPEGIEALIVEPSELAGALIVS